MWGGLPGRVTSVLEDDMPGLVRQAAGQADDLLYRLLPDTRPVVERDWRRHTAGLHWSWAGESFSLLLIIRR